MGIVQIYGDHSRIDLFGEACEVSSVTSSWRYATPLTHARDATRLTMLDRVAIH